MHSRKRMILMFAVCAFVAGGAVAAYAGAGGNDADAGALLSQLESGAKVTTNADGSVAVSGRLTAAAAAESRRMDQAADDGPNTIRCETGDVRVTCVAVADGEVVAALKQGDKNLFGRTVHGHITDAVIDRTVPLFEPDELTCLGVSNAQSLMCSRVDRVPPVIARGRTILVTYKRYNVTFGADGNGTTHLGRRTIPLRRG